MTSGKTVLLYVNHCRLRWSNFLQNFLEFIENVCMSVVFTSFHHLLNPEKPDVPLNKNDAFQKVQKRRVQEKRWARSYSAWSKPTVFLSLEPSLNGFKISFKSHCRFKIISYLYAIVRLLYLTPHPASCTASCLYI